MITTVIQIIVFLVIFVIILYWKRETSKTYVTRVSTKPSASKKKKKDEEDEEVKTKKKDEGKKKDDHHHDDDHDDHGHGGGNVTAKPEKVLSAIEKIFMWILLIPLILIITFIIIPSLFPNFWTDLGGPVLWEGKLFMPVVIVLILSILLSIIMGNIFPTIALLIFLGTIAIFIPEDKKEVNVMVWRIIAPNQDSILIKSGTISKDECYLYNYEENLRVTVLDCGKSIFLNSYGWGRNIILTGCTTPKNDIEQKIPNRRSKEVRICPY